MIKAAVKLYFVTCSYAKGIAKGYFVTCSYAKVLH